MTDLLKFKYVPLQAGYSGEVDSGVISQQLDGGAPRFRRVSSNNVSSVSCSFKFDELGYQYMMAFYRIWCRAPSKPFHIEMFLDDPVVSDYKVWFVPNSVKLTSKNGLIYNVSVQLIVEASAVNTLLDDKIVEIVNGDAADMFNPLEKVVNVTLPKALENLND